MPEQPESPRGLRELREVIARYNNRGRLALHPDEMDHIASHLYHGNSDAYRAGGDELPLPEDSYLLDPEQWQKFARLGDRFDDGSLEEGELVFDEDPQAHRKILRRGEIGQGWTDEDVKAKGQGKASFELSPGDKQAHAWLRDREFLEGMLGRTPESDLEAEEDRRFAMSQGGSHMMTPLESALHYYERSKDANFSHGSNGWDPWRTANFKRYASNQATLQAMENPEFAAGAVLGPMQAIGQFASHQAVEHPEEKDFMPAASSALAGGALSGFGPAAWLATGGIPGMTARDTPVIGPALGAVGDFASNLTRSLLDGSAPGEALDAWRNSTSGKNINNISPIIPQSSQKDWVDSPAQREQSLGEVAKTHADARGMSQDDYWRAEKGQVPSYAGSLLGEALYEAPLDPLTLSSMGVGAAAGIARGVAGGLAKNAARGAAKATLKRSLLSGAKHLGNETLQEAGTSVPLTAAIHAGIEYPKPSWGQMFKPGIENRPDLASSPDYIKDDGEFQGKMKTYDADQAQLADREYRYTEAAKAIQNQNSNTANKAKPAIKPGSVPMAY